MSRFIVAVLLLISCGAVRAVDPKDYAPVHALFREHCVDCHSQADTEGGLVLESYQALMKGGDSGPSIVPGKAGESLMVKFVEGFERRGEKLIMPPGRRKKLSQEQIALIRAWIDAGAPPPAGQVVSDLDVPAIEPRVKPRSSINALAWNEAKNLLALARPDAVELRAPETREIVRSLKPTPGNTLAVVFSKDGSHLYVAGGQGGVGGEIRFYNVADGALIRTIESHSDSIYALALSPDGKVLASGSYDQKIKLWNTETGEELRALSGHTGAVYALAFRPDGKILASASGDRTVKLWDVATGERRDTLAQSLKEVYAVAFSPDGKHLIAGGVDNRIRLWSISEQAAETSNPLVVSKFAHEGAILRLAFSQDGKWIASTADDKTVKLWEPGEITEKLALEKQSDWPVALAFVDKAKGVAVGRLDGGLEIYSQENGKPLPLPKPELARLHPRGVQRGISVPVRAFGKNLGSVTNAVAHHEKLKVTVNESGRTGQALWLEARAEGDLPRGAYEVSLAGAGGETAPLKLYVDDLPHLWDDAPTNIAQLPAIIWGSHEKLGEVDSFSFEATQGETIVFDASARSLGSKANVVLTLRGNDGETLATQRTFNGAPDPFLAHTFNQAGRFTLEVSELTPAASADRFYRVTAGALPFALAATPLAGTQGKETGFTLIGHNLGDHASLSFTPSAAGELPLPVDAAKVRTRSPIKIKVSDSAVVGESEPNDGVSNANSLAIESTASGAFLSEAETDGDVDFYRFEAKAGDRLVIETFAQKLGSPADTKIEILTGEGRPIERLLLQAVRDSAVTFRPMDSAQPGVRLVNWEEMDLREYVYMQGDVMRKFRMPQGPDSDSLMFTLNGMRRAYFDTTATAHALDEPAYIVVPQKPGAKLPSTGLPVFPVHFENDDAGERDRGSDSKVHFTAPSDGAYQIRVSEARGAQSAQHLYALTLRRAKPDYSVTINPTTLSIPEGSGQSFSVAVQRFDDFDGEIRVDLEGAPEGLEISTPIVVEAGHVEARGNIFARPGAKVSSTNIIAARATAVIDGSEVQRTVAGISKLSVTAKPRALVSLFPTHDDAGDSAEPRVITVQPGGTVPAWIKVERNGHDELLTFSVDNLPHGVIVDNIGLNGVLIPKGENEREIFITAAKWVGEMDRLCFAIENQAGRQTSKPVLLRVRKQPAQPIQQAAAK